MLYILGFLSVVGLGFRAGGKPLLLSAFWASLHPMRDASVVQRLATPKSSSPRRFLGVSPDPCRVMYPTLVDLTGVK